MTDLGRLLTAMVSPFTPDGALDLPRAAELAEKLVAEGSDGLVVSGTTGESPTLSRAEKLDLLRAVKAAVGDRARVVMGTGSYATGEAVSLSRDAAGAGADAVLVIAPYYNKPNQAGLYAHFSAIASAVDVPVVLYNHPGRTGVTIAPETVARLHAAHPNVNAIKDSSGSLDLATQYRLAAPGVTLYSGDDPLTLPFLALGARGVVSVTSHVAGPAVKALLDAWAAGDTLAARTRHEALFALSKALFIAPSPAPVKAALAELGFPVGGVRLPLVDMDDAERQALRAALGSREVVRV